MVWSLLYGLTRSTLGAMLLRFRGETAKDAGAGQPDEITDLAQHGLRINRLLDGARTAGAE